jgi:alkylation response protein AidB-like acyl-CoA dehydrogenase
MDFSFSDEQVAVRDLAEQIFGGMADVERIREVEATDDRFDRELWAQLAEAGLLGIGLPEEHGGAGLGLVETLLVLEQQGRRVAPVPYWSTIVCGALPLVEFGSEAQTMMVSDLAAGIAVFAAAFDDVGSADPSRPATVAVPDGDEWQLTGVKPVVAFAPVADLLVVSASLADGSTGLFLVDPEHPGVLIESVDPTNHTSAGRVELDGAAGDRLGDDSALDWTLDRARVGLAALQVGITEEAVAMTASFVSEREQFGKPLSTNQGVALRAADAYIGTAAIRATCWQAAWLLSVGRDARAEVLATAWWTAEGGHQVLHATQHLHGGMGSDIDYPVHRYFTWGKQIGDTLGAPSATAAALGDVLADRAKEAV